MTRTSFDCGRSRLPWDSKLLLHDHTRYTKAWPYCVVLHCVAVELHLCHIRAGRETCVQADCLTSHTCRCFFLLACNSMSECKTQQNVISTPTSSCPAQARLPQLSLGVQLRSLDSDFWHFEGGNRGGPPPSYDWSCSSGEHTPSVVPFLILCSKINTVYWPINMKMGAIVFWAERRAIIPSPRSWN